uniref:Protein kinase domain-containing protein n=1 Tax=Gadus morhua TaxID=8049 RepID=A0A8C5AUS6_GADMO
HFYFLLNNSTQFWQRPLAGSVRERRFTTKVTTTVTSWISDMENYIVLEPLGSGGFGEVLKCRSLRSGNFFAMKRFFAPDETHHIFQRELAPLSVLKHDNVIRLLTAFLHGGLMHAIFELLEHSLCDELKKKGCGLESLTIKKYSFQILRAVDFIHSHNIMHRDIKPDNLLVSRSGVLKLADFGSGRASNHAAVPLTRAAGTMWFSAPEMLVMDPDYNKPVDVWAVGCTLVFMTTGNYFLKGERFLEHIKMIITKVGPLTAIQEQQYLNNVKHAREFAALPLVHPTTDLMEKYGISDPLFPKELEKMVDQDQSVHLMVEQDSFPPITTWEKFQERNNSPTVERVDEEKCRRGGGGVTCGGGGVSSWISDMENYEVLERLGSGGSAEVRRCRSLRSGNFFAMKRFFAPDETHLIFQRELLKIKGCGLESLTIKKYSFQILRAVDFIHSRNIMHRDIKPDNLLVSCSGVLKLADFGSSRASNHSAEPLTRDAGAMLFSAPEMLLMDPDYNKPVDVWAVGCTLVFMATGNYFLNGERFLEHIKMIITKVGPLTEKYGISDPLLAQLVEMCLQMDPVDRWRCSALLRHPYYTQDHFHESYPKELEEMVDHDQSVHLMVEQESLPPITTWEKFQERNNSPPVERVDEEKCCWLPSGVHLRELWKDITEALIHKV